MDRDEKCHEGQRGLVGADVMEILISPDGGIVAVLGESPAIRKLDGRWQNFETDEDVVQAFRTCDEVRKLNITGTRRKAYLMLREAWAIDRSIKLLRLVGRSDENANVQRQRLDLVSELLAASSVRKHARATIRSGGIPSALFGLIWSKAHPRARSILEELEITPEGMSRRSVTETTSGAKLAPEKALAASKDKRFVITFSNASKSMAFKARTVIEAVWPGDSGRVRVVNTKLARSDRVYTHRDTRNSERHMTLLYIVASGEDAQIIFQKLKETVSARIRMREIKRNLATNGITRRGRSNPRYSKRELGIRA
jgi:hypothetical protein